MAGVKGCKKIFRICPYCGLNTNTLASHIKREHPNVPWSRAIADYLKLSNIPLCPECGKECSTKSFSFNHTCGDRHCNERNKVRRGTHGLLKRNCKFTADGKMLRVIHSNEATLRSGNHSSQQKKIDPNKTSKIYVIVFDEFIKLGKTRNLIDRLRHLNEAGLFPYEMYTWEVRDDIAFEIEHSIHRLKELTHVVLNYQDKGFHSIGRTEFYDKRELMKILDLVKSKLNDYPEGVGSSEPKYETLKI